MAATGALASGYGNNNGYNQRKMAPTPSHYGGGQRGYGHEQQSYGAAEMSSYDAGHQQQSYGAPAAAAATGYGKQSVGYGKAAGAYGQSAGGYGKAAKYEEPSVSIDLKHKKHTDIHNPKREPPRLTQTITNTHTQYPPMPFAWGYDINDGYGGAQYHKESGDEYGKRTGSYGYTDAYGVYRQVDYVADEYGFRATIKTNEPGTANESPADVELHAYEPPSNYYAGNKDTSYGKQSSYGASSGSSYGNSGSSSYGNSGSSYGNSGSSYGGSSYGAASVAAPAAASYGQQSSSYSAPRATSSYGNNNQGSYGSARSSYKQQSNSYNARPQQHYEQSAQYSSSNLVPVKVAPAPVAAVAAKKY